MCPSQTDLVGFAPKSRRVLVCGRRPTGFLEGQGAASAQARLLDIRLQARRIDRVAVLLEVSLLISHSLGLLVYLDEGLVARQIDLADRFELGIPFNAEFGRAKPTFRNSGGCVKGKLTQPAPFCESPSWICRV